MGSVRDRLYRRLKERKQRTFLIHQSIKGIVDLELENKLFFPKAPKRRFPFDEQQRNLKVPETGIILGQGVKEIRPFI